VAGQLVLIVEDNERNRRSGTCSSSGATRPSRPPRRREGIRLAREQQPALILMDIQLPGIDGIAALGHLRADPGTRAIPVMAVTASAMTHDRHKVLAAGFDAYQSKPIRVSEFVDAVRQILERP
jgi:two-component system cell cycle response regulator DivK